MDSPALPGLTACAFKNGGRSMSELSCDTAAGYFDPAFCFSRPIALTKVRKAKARRVWNGRRLRMDGPRLGEA